VKPKPKAKQEGGKHNTGQKVLAAYQGNHEPLPTAFAELLTGFVQLGIRLPKAADLPCALNLHSFKIQQATDTKLPSQIEALARDLAATLQRVNAENLPDLLRKTAAVIASRPLQRHPAGTRNIVLKPADATTVAAFFTAWRNAAKELPSQRIITEAEMIEHLQTMPPKDRVEEIKKLTGLTPDEEGRTVRRKLTRLFPELRLPPGRGRPKKPDK
jgi:hypothetical protein